jgi:hypothetical protein
MRMKRELLGGGHAFSKEGFPYLAISFHTRAYAIEIMFGDVENEKPNLAYSVCQSLMKLNAENRVLAIQNIVLSGGSIMVPGFKLRFRQEMKAFIDNNKEFSELRDLRNRIETPESVYAPNYLTWIGGSIMMSLSTGNEPVKESERFLVTAE